MATYKPLQQKAYEFLKEKILEGELEPDTLYSETRLAAEINISRTPMKDALVRLSQERFIDIIPSKGFQLHKISDEDIWDTYQIRTAIEGFCAVNLIGIKNQPAGKEWLDKLEETLMTMQELSDKNAAISDFWKYDLEFHRTLVNSSSNKELIQTFEAYNYRLSVIANQSFRPDDRKLHTLDEHRAILHAIKTASGLEDMRVYLAVMDHMEAARDIVLADR